MGVLPFVVGELVVVALLIAFPEIALWLPGQMR
jgi:TRAP-type mannitol/chloroaromatic compound transport system permease large subunit